MSPEEKKCQFWRRFSQPFAGKTDIYDQDDY